MMMNKVVVENIDAFLRQLQDPTIRIEELVHQHTDASVTIDLVGLVDRVIEVCGEGERITHIPSHRTSVVGDPHQLALAIVSLMYVATAGPPIGSLLDVRTARIGSRAQVMVTVNTTAAKRSKGLSVARRLVRNQGGDIVVTTGPGVTRYCVDMPASIRSITGSISVLLVDDSIDQLMALSELLQHDGLTIHVATSGADALARIHGAMPDVVVSDVDLPDMSGIDVIRRARQQRPQIRTVLVSGYPSNHPAVAGMLSEVSAYFSKPVNIDELLEVVVPACRGLDS
jgi:CheY-like chemotaxis protein